MRLRSFVHYLLDVHENLYDVGTELEGGLHPVAIEIFEEVFDLFGGGGGRN